MTSFNKKNFTSEKGHYLKKQIYFANPKKHYSVHFKNHCTL
jgi:hypothetical protein